MQVIPTNLEKVKQMTSNKNENESNIEESKQTNLNELNTELTSLKSLVWSANNLYFSRNLFKK